MVRHVENLPEFVSVQDVATAFLLAFFHILGIARQQRAE
jgi:hypothetical protein